MDKNQIVEKELSYQIIQAAIEVHRELGPGFPEKIYEEAFSVVLNEKKLEIEKQKRVEVVFRNRVIGEYFLDLVVQKKIILELKAVSEIAKIHEQQALSYLKATGMELAIVINFGASRLEYRRVVNTRNRIVNIPRLPNPK